MISSPRTPQLQPKDFASPKAMVSNFSSYFFTGSRAKILCAALAFFSLTVLFSFHGQLVERGSWLIPGQTAADARLEEADVQTGRVLETSWSSPTQFASPVSYEVEAHDTDDGTAPAGDAIPTVPASALTAKSRADDVCQGFPDTSDVVVVMKTGATEAYDKLPIHFMSDLRCVKDHVIFSDMRMNMAGYEVHDVLEGLGPEFTEHNNDFDLYRELQRVYREHQDPRDLKTGNNGWNLDKYKFVPMLDRTWKYRSDAKWYVFIEADTFIQWENTMTYLNKLDPEEPLYIGSPTHLDIEFAHGGTGYVISHAAMQKAVGNVPNLVHKYAGETSGICCGDRMTAKVMLDAGIRLTRAWPMFNGEKPLTLPYSPQQWCQPVMTMHHLTAQEVSKMWNFETKRRNASDEGPMVWKDVFNYFVMSNLRPKREDWENLSGDLSFSRDREDFDGRTWDQLSYLEKASPESPDKCKDLCDSDSECYQWQHHGTECQINHSIRFGWAKQPEGDVRWISGWDFERINFFRQEMQECNEVIDWTTHPPDS